MIYLLSLKRAEDAEAKVKAFEAEITGLKQRLGDTRDLLMRKASNLTYFLILSEYAFINDDHRHTL